MAVSSASTPTAAGKRERNKAENRAAILAAAARVFADLGYEAATVRDIVGATELAAGTFYNYFPDKESVLRSLLEEKVSELQARSRAARRGATTVDEIVAVTLAASFEIVASDPEVFAILRRNAGAVRAVLDEPSFVANRDDLRRDLARAMKGSGDAGVDAELLAAALSGLAFEVAACAADRPPSEMAAAARFAADLALGGVARLKASARRKRSSLTLARERTKPRKEPT